MPKIIDLRLNFDEEISDFIKKHHKDVATFRILSKSLDARAANLGRTPKYLYRLELFFKGDELPQDNLVFEKIETDIVPIIIGAGPAGLFAALRFSEYGIKTIVIERGERAQKRMLHISKYWREGKLDPESNVCFGEGGAGLFSDGKLITRIKSPLVKYVMKKFVDFGAPKETAYLSNPHLGSNKIRAIISKISGHLIELGHTFLYNTKVEELLTSGEKVVGVKLSNGEILKSSFIILATGHSAHDIFYELKKKKIAMSQKDFAVGVRIEHKRDYIDEIQYGKFKNHPLLGASKYKLTYYDKKTTKGTYSFCMCPGGYVLSSGTNADGMVVNGMSNFARNSPWSNSAIVVTVQAGVDFDGDDVLAGLYFQREIEKKSFELSLRYADARSLPAMYVGEFMDGKLSDRPLPKTSSPSSIFKADLYKIFPKFITDHLKSALSDYDKKLKGYSSRDAVLIAPETRTSSPVTVLRDKNTLESLSHKGFYPVGEGAGYAGGITSAAVDGILTAESIIKKIKNL